MAENKKNKTKAVPDPWGGWDTTDPKYIADVKKDIENYYEKNIEEPFDPDPGNYCDDCREGKSHDLMDQGGMKIRVHKHSQLEPLKLSEEVKEVEKLLPAQPVMTGYSDIDDFLWECLDTMRKKGHDYRQGNDDDLLHNFRSVGLAVDEDMMKVWFTYFYKHYSAVVTYIKEGGQSESEPIDGRIKDMIVYLLLFYRMTQERGRAMHGVIS